MSVADATKTSMTMPHVPPTLIETERLLVRQLERGDAASLAQVYAANAARLADSFPHARSITTADAAERYVLAKSEEWACARGFWYGLFGRADSSLLGQAQIKNVDWTLRRAELAYWIDRRHEGQGLATEAVTALLRVCLTGLALHRVFLRIVAGNERSEALARRLGFTPEGTLRDDFLTPGGLVSIRYFGLLATDAAAAPFTSLNAPRPNEPAVHGPVDREVTTGFEEEA